MASNAVDSRTILPRSAFMNITGSCAAIFEKYGFPIYGAGARIVDPLPGALEKCCAVFGDIEPLENVVKQAKIPADLSVDKLRRMTLECAIVFHRNGVQDILFAPAGNNRLFSPGLQAIATAILEVITGSGYELPPGVHYLSAPCWGAYLAWKELAEMEGMQTATIREVREWFKENMKQLYEE